jgi:DNA-binding PadR family transcriptional regulator
VNRYLRYCLGKDLIRIVSERRTRSRYTSKTYALSDRGSRLLAIFDEEREETIVRGSRPH